MSTFITQSNENTGDLVQNLPTDLSVPNHNEMIMVDTLFKQKKGTIDKILYHSKDMIILAVLFMLLSIPLADDLVNSLLPSTKTSKYILVFIKALLFVLLYFFIYNFYLIKKE